MITNRPKGTQDWFGENMWKRTKIEAIARELCGAYNIGEIITPAFEHTVLFNRSVGDTFVAGRLNQLHHLHAG